MKILFGEADDMIGGFLATAISGFANLGKGIGIGLGALVYGVDAAKDATNALNAEADAMIAKRAFEKLEKELAPLRRELKSVEDAGSNAMAKLYGVTLKGAEAYDALQAAMSRVQRELAALNGNESLEGMRKRIETDEEAV
jgi:predicted  nucleic acid-binding Zn-ribbon protein